MDDNDFFELEQLFFTRGYKWKVGKTLIAPSATEIKETVNKAVEKLADEPAGSILEVGRLMVRKNYSGNCDVFTMIGEIK